MKNDLYTKAVLTVIALALVAIATGPNAVFKPAHAEIQGHDLVGISNAIYAVASALDSIAIQIEYFD